MSNTLGTLSSALIIQRALELVNTERPELNAISTDFSGEGALLNQQVTSRIHTIPAVSNFNSSAAPKVDIDVPVTLNQHKEVKHVFTVAEYSATDRNLVTEAARPIAAAIGNHMVDALAEFWGDPENYSTTHADTGAMDRATGVPNATVIDGTKIGDADTEATYRGLFLPVRRAFAKRGVPKQSRFIVLNADVYADVLSDATVVAWFNNQRNMEAIAEGQLPKVAGILPFEYPDLADGEDVGLVGFAGTKDSVIIATRVQKDPRLLLNGAPFPGNYSVITNEATGLSVLLTEWIDPGTMTANVRVSWMYGVAVGDPNNGQLVLDAELGS